MTDERHGPPIDYAVPDLMAGQIAHLREAFPECVTEGQVDFDKLRAALGEEANGAPERYSFTWTGKQNAIRVLQTPTRATLVPARAELLDWGTTENIFIEGDNLEALKLLYKPYFGRVKMIYIDPPYNTGNDFIYPDNYTDPLRPYLQVTGQMDAEGNLLTSNPQSSGRYHSAWLSMMYPRLFLARQLLRDDGVIFISIDDNEVHHLRLLMNELFGEENFLAVFVWKRRSGAMDAINNVSADHEYVMCFGKAATALAGTPRTFERYENPDNDPRGPWIADNLSAAKPGGNTYYPIKDPKTGYEYWPPRGRYWPYNPQVMQDKIAEGRIIFSSRPAGPPLLKRFQYEAKSLFRPVSSWLSSGNGSTDSHNGDVETLRSTINTEGTREIKALFDDKVFTYPKPVALLKSLIQQGASCPKDIILDFFAGSCTTGQAVLEMNREDGNDRRFILVQLPEPTGRDDYPTIADIGKERIRRVSARMKAATAATLLPENRSTPEDLGFKAFTLAPSNYKPWVGLPIEDCAAYREALDDYREPLVPDWQPINVIYEVALKEGYGLNMRIESVDSVTQATVWRLSDPEKAQALFLCLDEHIDMDTLRPLHLCADDILICRDSALDDTTAANLALQCKFRTI